jgi:hypothetical protein
VPRSVDFPRTKRCCKSSSFDSLSPSNYTLTGQAHNRNLAYLCGIHKGDMEIPTEELGLDPGIEHAVRVLRDAGVETTESCQGGGAHLPRAYREILRELLGGF